MVARRLGYTLSMAELREKQNLIEARGKMFS